MYRVRSAILMRNPVKFTRILHAWLMDHRGQWYYLFACLVEYERDPLLCLFDRDRMLERDNPRTLSLEAAIPELPAWSISLDSSICSIVSRSMLELETLTEKSNSVILFLRRWGKVYKLPCSQTLCYLVLPVLVHQFSRYFRYCICWNLTDLTRYCCWEKNFDYFFLFLSDENNVTFDLSDTKYLTNVLDKACKVSLRANW